MKVVNNFNDLVIDVEAKLQRNRLDKELLIKESFILWYILTEGIHCESFSEQDIQGLLKRNGEIYLNAYLDDMEYNFIMGWMISITPWYFEPLFREEDGNHFLNKAYRRNPTNSLFKWAMRNELRLKGNEIEGLKSDIALRFDTFYGYGALIKEYFVDVINTKSSM